jgi:hypothetical protein
MVFQKDVYNVIPNVTVWWVLRERLHLKAYIQRCKPVLLLFSSVPSDKGRDIQQSCLKRSCLVPFQFIIHLASCFCDRDCWLSWQHGASILSTFKMKIVGEQVKWESSWTRRRAQLIKLSFPSSSFILLYLSPLQLYSSFSSSNYSFKFSYSIFASFLCHFSFSLPPSILSNFSICLHVFFLLSSYSVLFCHFHFMSLFFYSS